MTNQMQSTPPAPAATPVRSGGNRGLAIAALILGILSLCGSGIIWCGAILSVVGIVLGFLGIKTTGRGMAIAGIALSVVGLILAIILRVVFGAGGFFLQHYLNNIIGNGTY